jgi:alkylation response protein AidB-like acyl-CoA dehydrogenase
MSLVDAPTEEQVLLRDSLSRYLREEGEGQDEDKRNTWPSDSARLKRWRTLASDLGVLAAPFSEEVGGLGGGFPEHLIILEELGRVLFGEPYLSTAVFAGSLLKQTGGPSSRDLISRIISGESIVAVAHAEAQSRYEPLNIQTELRKEGDAWLLSGRKIVVDTAPWATQYLVTCRSFGSSPELQGVSIVALERETKGIRRRDFRTIDGIAASEMEFDAVRVETTRILGAPGRSGELLLQALDEVTLGTCAEALGVLRRMLDDTVEYTLQRRQFGRPIAEFQVLQHRMVDMYVELEQAISITRMAADQVQASSPIRAQAVSAAKWLVGRACRLIAQEAVQIHGAIGTTDEIAVSRFFKRATAFGARFGSDAHHLQRYIHIAGGTS